MSAFGERIVRNEPIDDFIKSLFNNNEFVNEFNKYLDTMDRKIISSIPIDFLNEKLGKLIYRNMEQNNNNLSIYPTLGKGAYGIVYNTNSILQNSATKNINVSRFVANTRIPCIEQNSNKSIKLGVDLFREALIMKIMKDLSNHQHKNCIPLIISLKKKLELKRGVLVEENIRDPLNSRKKIKVQVPKDMCYYDFRLVMEKIKSPYQRYDIYYNELIKLARPLKDSDDFEGLKLVKNRLLDSMIYLAYNLLYYQKLCGFVHGDLKKDNIYIANEQNIKFIDFGFSSIYLNKDKFRLKRNVYICTTSKILRLDLLNINNFSRKEKNKCDSIDLLYFMTSLITGKYGKGFLNCFFRNSYDFNLFFGKFFFVTDINFHDIILSSKTKIKNKYSRDFSEFLARDINLLNALAIDSISNDFERETLINNFYDRFKPENFIAIINEYKRESGLPEIHLPRINNNIGVNLMNENALRRILGIETV